MALTLTANEVRVLGALVEKSITTPEYYPLTLNALVAACNQKSNREPAMQIDDKEAVRVLDSLRDKGLVWSVTVTGSRAPKYRHRITDVYPLTPVQLAVMCELMLRGVQTGGELRTHAERMASFADGAELQSVLDGLAARPEGALVATLPRRAGQREERYTHLLGGPPAAEPPAAAPPPPPEPARRAVMAENERLAAVETQLAQMRDELARLTAQWADFLKQFQ